MRALHVPPAWLLAIAGLVVVASVFLSVSPSNPPGFYRDEGAITLNAATLASSGRDEYGARLPLFISSYGDYKSPLYVYLLASVFTVTGPSTSVARMLSAALGLAACCVIFMLAHAVCRRPLPAAAVALLAGLSPWLFEISRLVFEVALEPVLLAALLFAVHRAMTLGWNARRSVAVGLTLAAITYAYQAGRVLAPLLAVAVAVAVGRDKVRRLSVAAMTALVAVVPIGVYALVHPSALTERFDATTYIHGGTPWWRVAGSFLRHYAENLNLWDWAMTGDGNLRHHVPGAGSIFFVEVALALAGIAVILLRHRSDPWWRFVLGAVIMSPVAASLTDPTQHSLRMIALPVLLPVLALPAIELMASLAPRVRIPVIALVVVALSVEAIHWQIVFHDDGPKRGDAFEAAVKPVVEAALLHGGTIHTFRGDHTTSTASQLYARIAGRDASSVVILEEGEHPPVGSLVVGRTGECDACPVVAEDDGFEAYLASG